MVLSSDEGTMETMMSRGKSSEVVRWEKYLPTTVLRVLLVESDDSTRQIITALLQKCSYKGHCFTLFFKVSVFVLILNSKVCSVLILICYKYYVRSVNYLFIVLNLFQVSVLVCELIMCSLS